MGEPEASIAGKKVVMIIASEYFGDPTAHRIAQNAAATDKVVGAICIAPSTLAKAGLLKGKQAACYASERQP